MADVDPLAALALEPGERVLWQGRPGFGAPWREVREVLRGGLTVWLLGTGALTAVMLLLTLFTVVAREVNEPGKVLAVLVAGALGIATWWGCVVTLFVVALVVAKLVGPYHLSLLMLCTCGPICAAVWTSMALSRGWAGALARLRPEDFLLGLALVGLPLLRIVVGVLRRLSLVYVVTDRRAAAIRAGSLGARLLWTAPLVKDGRHQSRVIWPWGMRRRGHVAVGFGDERRDLALIEQPDHVVALVRDALGDAVRPLIARTTKGRRARPAPPPSEPALAPPPGESQPDVRA